MVYGAWVGGGMGWWRDGLKKLNYWKTSFSKAMNKWLKIVLGYLAHTTGTKKRIEADALRV